MVTSTTGLSPIGQHVLVEDATDVVRLAVGPDHDVGVPEVSKRRDGAAALPVVQGQPCYCAPMGATVPPDVLGRPAICRYRNC